ncbi:hypothetical protein HETIRDRAFT_101738 [Heterobasidion irregulare TC 32-1]|uniref:Uncharacterized protein n=1 Tax=Heterobasidion irregulare (strain TC 32-1) TaxID=747525 RepID=W4K699_HETIT|nr:uncharacterized protein HETIRDRAFT_101738 [Heterobasidion irregulare TC 32-1]ETW80601.1 hypothetical protein HETIRDRAFT_101738 [Heterobasidion irregulare TC 32-1]
MCILGPLEIGSSTSAACKRRSPRLGRRAFVSATTSPICAVSLAAAGFHLGRKLCRAVPPTLLPTTDPSVGHARMPPRALPARPPGSLRNPHGSRARGPENALFPAGSEGSIQRRGPVPASRMRNELKTTLAVRMPSAQGNPRGIEILPSYRELLRVYRRLSRRTSSDPTKSEKKTALDLATA